MTPVEINVTIDGEEVSITAQVDYANRFLKLPIGYRDMGIEDKFFQYMREYNDLPSGIFAVKRPPTPSPDEFTTGDTYE